MRTILALVAACFLGAAGCATSDTPSRERNTAGSIAEDMDGPFASDGPAPRPHEIYMR